jgi:hypothetical protein
MGRRPFSRARAIALLVLAIAALAAPAPAGAAAPAGWVLQDGAARKLDAKLAPGCRRTLAGGRAAAFCDGLGRVRHAIAVRGSVARPLVPGRSVRVSAPRASRRAQLALIYRSAGKTTYVRFQGFGKGRRLSAVVTSHRSGGRLVVRLRAGGRSHKPVQQSPLVVAAAPTPAPAPVAPAPATPKTFPGIDAVPGRTCGALPANGDAAFNALFATCGPGWTGGDAAYSVPLPGGRVAWLFSDSFLGELADDGSRRSADFVHNAIVVQDGSRLTTVHGGGDPKPGSVFAPADAASWYWVGDGTVEGDRLLVLLNRYHFTGGGIWDFKYDDSALATVSLSDMRVQSISPLPNPAVAWGAAVTETVEWTYVYGVEEQGNDKYAHVARAHAGNLGGAWEFWDGSAWTPDAGRSARVLSGVSNGFSVVPDGGGYALVTQQLGLGRDIHVHRAPSPEGPWAASQTIATVPDRGAGRFTYNAVLHPEFGSDGGLLLSYNVNSEIAGETQRDGSVYRPGFMRVTLPPGS